MDSCLKVQEQLGAELQKQVTKLSDVEEEHKRINESQSEEIRQLKDELKDLQNCFENEQKLLRDAEAQVSSMEKQKAEMENAAQEAEVRLTTFENKPLFLLHFLISYTMNCLSNTKCINFIYLDPPGDAN